MSKKQVRSSSQADFEERLRKLLKLSSGFGSAVKVEYASGGVKVELNVRKLGFPHAGQQRNMTARVELRNAAGRKPVIIGQPDRVLDAISELMQP